MFILLVLPATLYVPQVIAMTCTLIISYNHAYLQTLYKVCANIRRESPDKGFKRQWRGRKLLLILLLLITVSSKTLDIIYIIYYILCNRLFVFH